MQRILLALLLVFSASAVQAQTQENDPWWRYRAIAQINVSDGAGSWQGSGTLIATAGDQGLILTCRHVCPVVGMKVRMTWYGYDTQVTDGVVLYSMDGGGFDTDLALVVATIPKGARPVPVAKADVRNGPWRSVGYRGGRLLESVATGGRENGSILTLNAPYLGGMSGGATFDKYGRVVAVVVASNMFTTGLSSDGENLQTMLDFYR